VLDFQKVFLVQSDSDAYAECMGPYRLKAWNTILEGGRGAEFEKICRTKRSGRRLIVQA